MKLAETVTFGAASLDRAAHLRKSAAKLAKQPDARSLVFWRGRPLLERESYALAQLPLSDPIFKHASAEIFLGLQDNRPIFVHDISAWEPEPDQQEIQNSFSDTSEQIHPDAPAGHSFKELRSVLAQLSRDDAELAATAKGIFGWHQKHKFCANCGASTKVGEAGWQRDCDACKTPHFPRTDPVVIMLVTHGNETLLGRSPNWPAGMYSCLAGFMEPGETVEAAVRREVFEESGVRVGEIDYITSQPWPFPSSLMIGCHGRATTTKITRDEIELEDALWASKETLLESLSGHSEKLLLARPGSIAHFLIDHWLKGAIS